MVLSLLTSCQLGIIIAQDFFPEAVDYFYGRAGGDDLDSDDEDDDSEDDDAEEIDLEKPRTKKAKHA
jgi:template-activating factor I